MTKEENRGLLSRMLRLFFNPLVKGAKLDHPALGPESLTSQQRLQKMMNRRTRNDFVRQREFDMLRKLRRDNLAGEQDVVRPSLLHSSNELKPDEWQRVSATNGV